MRCALPRVKQVREYGYGGELQLTASVIVVTYGPRKDGLRACLDGLRRQSTRDFEVILVENGSHHISDELVAGLMLKYVRLDENYGPMLARNVGAYYAGCELLIFLEDDGVPAPDFVESHVQSYENPEIIGVRGRYIPATDHHNPYISGAYDLGEALIPALLNIEGNCSVKKSNFIAAGGWSAPIYAHQGIVLTYELIRGGELYDRVVYNPKSIVFHDNNKTLTRSLRLSFLRRKNLVRLEHDYPDLKKFIKIYESGKPLSKKRMGLRQRLSFARLIRAALFRLHALSGFIGEKSEIAFQSVVESSERSIVDVSFFDRFSP